jgi:hypothetical protein
VALVLVYDMTSVEERFAAIEAANRRWRYLTFVCIALAIVAWRLAPPAAPETVTAESFALVDAGGAVRAELKITDGGPALLLYDDMGVARVSLGHDSEGTALYLRDAAGDTRIGVAQFAHGGGGFALHGPEAKGAAVLYLKQSGTLTFYDDEGGVIWQAPGN